MISEHERPQMQAPEPQEQSCAASGEAAVIKTEVQRQKREATELGRYSIRIAVALSLIWSLVVVTIISKKQLTNYLWADLAAFAVPIPIALYFRHQIVWFGAIVYVAFLILALGVAVVFGI